MAKIAVFDMAGQQVSERELSDAVFAVTPNEAVMHAMVVNYLANQRQGTQSTLTRTEVAGGGRKPWRQKGTGRARQGLHQSSAVDTRRHRVRTEAERLHRHPQQEGEASRYEVRTLQQGSG